MSYFPYKKSSGLTLVETLVGVALLLVVMLGLYGMFRLSLRAVSQSRARLTALSLANQRIEMVRNMPYDKVGTIGGVPSGSLPQEETITKNNFTYTIKTSVIYVDDPFDGQVPDDTLPKDYKKVRVEVSWRGVFGLESSVFLVTTVAPKGIESEAGGGTLFISVFDANGLPVPQADLHIVNNQVNPTIDAYYQTNDKGEFVLVGAPESIESYQITVSKLNYSTDRTYGVDEVANPVKPHASVIEGDLTEISFAIDKVSSFSVRTLSENGFIIPNVVFHLRGDKIIGTDTNGDPVYKYSENHQTGSDGTVTISGLEWDTYIFSVDKTTTGLDLTTTTPSQPIDLLPNTNQNIDLILRAENTLLVTVLDRTTGQPIFGAGVRLTNLSLAYDETRPTDQQGQAFFIPLEPVAYNLEVQASGYQSYSGPIGVSGDTSIEIELEPE